MIGIYSITNKINNKKYIGQSINIEERIKRHFRDLKSGCHHSKHLQNAFNKYGEENFVSEVLFECKSIQELDEKEIEFIKKYDSFHNGYNLNEGGAGNRGVIFSDETREKIRQLVTGEKNPNYGHKWTQKMKDDLSKKFSDGSRKGGNNARAVKVIRVEDCRVYDYMGQAARDIGLKDVYSISRCLTHKSYVAAGYHFVQYSKGIFEFLSNEDNRFIYLCYCYMENDSKNIIADIKNKTFYTKCEFIKKINHEFRITTREISNILKTNNVIRFGENVYQLLVA